MRRSKKTSYFLSIIYFMAMVILAFAIYYDNEIVTYINRIICMLLIFIIYFLNSFKKDKIYLYSLICCFISVLLFFDQTEKGVLSAGLFFIIYRVLMIKIVLKKAKKVRMIPIFLGSLPFLSFLSYIIFLTHSSLGNNFYPAVIHVLLISLLAGIVLSNYILEDDVRNTWLLTSMLFFTTMIFVFIIERYYLEIELFSPLRSITFFAGQYLFLRYILLSENHTIMDFPVVMTEESVSK